MGRQPQPEEAQESPEGRQERQRPGILHQQHVLSRTLYRRAG